MSELSFAHQPVTHRRFGRGHILERSGRTLTVSFQEYGTHTFLYPDVFEVYLKADDAALTQAIEADLAAARTQHKEQEASHQRHIAELTARLAQERVAERKAKSAASSRARKPAVKPISTPPSA